MPDAFAGRDSGGRLTETTFMIGDAWPKLRGERSRIAQGSQAEACGYNVRLEGSDDPPLPPPRRGTLLSLSVGTGAVEVNQDVAWLGAFARSDNTAVLQLVHDARGARITKSQPALHQ